MMFQIIREHNGLIVILRIYAGFNKLIRAFDINSPGRGCEQYNTVLKDSPEHSLHGKWGLIFASRVLSIPN